MPQDEQPDERDHVEPDPVDAIRAKRRVDPIGLAEPVSLSDRQRIYESFYYEDERRRPYLSRFIVLMILSAAIAGLGLVNDSAAVVIGAMLIAPLMTPLLANSAALVEGWPRRFGESTLIVLLGAGLGILVGIVIALAIPRVGAETLLPGEILGRTEPNLVDLAIALAAGAAGAYVMIRSEAGSALPGVGIAVALVPPLAAVGITLGIGETDLAAGALLLFATNWLAIVFAAGVVFALAGFARHRDAWGRFQGSIAGLGLVALLVILAIPLGVNAVQRWGDSNANRVAAEILEEWNPTYLIEKIVVDNTTSPMQVLVDLAGSSAPQDTDVLADELAENLEEPVILKIRFRPEFIAGEVGTD